MNTCLCRFHLLVLTFLFAFALGSPAQTNGDSANTNTSTIFAPTTTGGVENSVVKVFSSVRYPDPFKPWTKRSPEDVSGTGVVIKGKRILTNAHVVSYASQIQIQANQAGDKLSATVEFIAPGIDLAVLKLDDESFFDSHPPLEMTKTLPQIKDSVLAYGYPEGGTSLSITKGIVSRIEFTGYHQGVSGLRVQVDAAINPGNSGGPAVVGDKMVGLVFSRLGRADNIGYIIPSEEIELFLNDIADGHYDGKPAIYDDFQTMENPVLHTYLKLDKSVEGMIVHKPFSDAADYPLKEWDVVTHIGDAAVDDQGMIKLNADVRLPFLYMVQKIAKDGKVPLTLMRNGKELKVEEPVATIMPQLLPDLDNAYPPYFICGPMVFSVATKEFVDELLGGENAERWIGILTYRGSPLVSRFVSPPAFDGEELVVVSSPFFPHKLSEGYSQPFALVVKSINGTQIKNLNHLVEVIRDCKDDDLVVAFDAAGKDETMVFPRKEMIAATDDILTDNGIRSQGSMDTMLVWNAKPH